MKYISIAALQLAAAYGTLANPIDHNALALGSAAPAGPVEARTPQSPKHLRPYVEKRQEFAAGEPIDANGKGAPILGWLRSTASCQQGTKLMLSARWN